MLEYLSLLDTEIGKRLQTLKKDIASESSSFYNSYRALCEAFVRFVLISSGVPSDSVGNSISKLLSDEVLLNALIEQAQTPPSAIEKIKSYVLKINRHVHEREKELSLEIVIKYVLALYDFTSPYASYCGKSSVRPTHEEIKALYASQTVGMSQIHDEISMLSKKIDTIAEEKNRNTIILDPIQIPNFFLASERMLINILGSKFKDKKPSIIYISLAILVLYVLQSTFSITGCELYSTYLLFQHIWLIFVIVIMIKVGFARQNILADKFDKKAPCNIEYVGNGMIMAGKMKTRYMVFLILNTIAVVGDIICINEKWRLPFIVTAVLSTVLSYILYFKTASFFSNYAVTRYIHPNIIQDSERYRVYAVGSNILPPEHAKKMRIIEKE